MNFVFAPHIFSPCLTQVAGKGRRVALILVGTRPNCISECVWQKLSCLRCCSVWSQQTRNFYWMFACRTNARLETYSQWHCEHKRFMLPSNEKVLCKHSTRGIRKDQNVSIRWSFVRIVKDHSYVGQESQVIQLSRPLILQVFEEVYCTVGPQFRQACKRQAEKNILFLFRTCMRLSILGWPSVNPVVLLSQQRKMTTLSTFDHWKW